ncbi:hypothetical protein [Cellulosilyticum sp. I15G10I2]|uniref:hypothetical protein n=1 Tax=Cellulosilyticum sp. I15G10I2 TaxID=1892843 RepID=UPI00085BD982|nr:hypothetical protein [Cellulosilyticum sp. I15G10I2]
MSTTETWNRTNKVGIRAENLFMKVMTDRGHKIKDVRLDKEYQKKDIDFILKNAQSGSISSYECKGEGEMYKYGNFCVEKYQDADTGRKGWFYYTEADYIATVDVVSEIIYMYHFEDLQSYINIHESKLRLLSAWDKASDNSNKKLHRKYWLVNWIKFKKWLTDNDKVSVIIDVNESTYIF